MTAPTLVPLTPAQRLVVNELCADGPDNQTIADRLGMGIETVKTHMRVAMATTGYRTRTAMAVAIHTGRVQIVPTNERRGRKPTPRPGTVHRAPRPGAILQATGCCHQLTTELPDSHGITSIPENVTCPGMTT